jgi:hypothetical protein
MKRKDITVLAHYDSISLYYTLYPLLVSRHRARFRFTNDLEYCLRRDGNKRLLIVRYIPAADSGLLDPWVLGRLRNKYDHIVYFDDGASTGKTRFEVLPYVSYYYKRHLLRNRADYCREYYGSLIFSDYYHRAFGISDDKVTARVATNMADLGKLKLGWNLGAGIYPKSTFLQKLGVFLSRRGAGASAVFHAVRTLTRMTSNNAAHPNKSNIVHSRFSLFGRPTMDFQRNLILTRLSGRKEVLTGTVPQRQYNREIRSCQFVLSPFGWGELCFRDFEAILNKATLIKPSVSHLETWPDVFIEGETYIPVNWDMADLNEKMEFYLTRTQDARRIADNAYRLYSSFLEPASLERRVEELLSDLSV